MQPRASLLEKFRDRRIGCRRLKELERRWACRNELRPDALRRDVFGSLDVQPERVAEERQRRLEIGDGNADVIQNRLHDALRAPFAPRPITSSAAEYGSIVRVTIRSTSFS